MPSAGVAVCQHPGVGGFSRLDWPRGQKGVSKLWADALINLPEHPNILDCLEGG